MVRGKSGVATDLAWDLVVPTVDGAAVMADDFNDVNVAAVLRAFWEAGKARLESDLERDKDVCEMLAGCAVGEGGVATEDGE